MYSIAQGGSGEQEAPIEVMHPEKRLARLGEI